MKKRNIMVVLLVFIFLLVSCKKNYVTQQYNAHSKVAFITMMQSGQTWGEIKNGAKIARDETNCTLDFFTPVKETDSRQQAQYVLDAIKNGYNAIIIAPSDERLLLSPLQKAQDQGIKIMTIYNSIDSTATMIPKDMMTSFTSVGTSIATTVLPLLPDKNIDCLVIGAMLNTTSAIKTTQGIRDVLKKQPKLRFQTAYCFGDSDKAADITEKKLKEDTDTNLIIAIDEVSSDGIMQAIRNREDKGKDLVIVTWGNSLSNLQGLEEGNVDAIVAINGYELGYRSIYAMMDYLEGKDVPDVPVEYALVTQNNFIDDKIQKLLFPQIN